MSERPPAMRQSKKCSASGISRASASTPWTRRKRRISSWNGSGRPAASSATTSPSRMKGSPERSRRAISTTSGRLRVTSDSRRVHTSTRSPARCSWMRAPSYLYSSAVRPPCAASTEGKSSAISASIGSSGTKGRGLAPATAAAPPVAASTATAVRSPSKSAARRVVATSTPHAAAIASSSSPSETPVRISPPTIRARKSRSSSDAREARRARRSSRARRTPEPAAAATSANASATWRSVRGTRSASASPGRSAGNPRTPSTRGSDAGKARADRKATAMASSSGASALRNRATSSRFSRRPRARSSRRPRAAKSAKRVIPCILDRMRRLVLHEADPAVSAVAATLADAYDVRPLGTAPAADAVILVTPRAPRPEGEAIRVLGLVPAADAGPWPAGWHAVLPLAAPSAMLEHAVAAAFADLDAAAERARLERDLSELNAIGIRLSSESNPRFLLETILSKAREITNSDAGSLYIIEERGETPHLRFALAQNDSLAVPFRTATLPLTDESIAGHVALTGDVINLADAYEPPADAPFMLNRRFDDEAGYRTKSMLVVPMRTPQGQTIGALQLINCKDDREARLAGPADVERHVRRYGALHEKLAGSLASQAAVAIYNRRLYLSIRELFEGFVKASVTAIEARDPTTSGHSFRVADLTVALAEVVDRCETGPYRELKFRDDEVMELRYASLLHDFGKVGVREHVLVKAKKLYPADLERIRHRVELLKRDLALRTARAKLDRAVARADDYVEQAARLDAELAAAVAELDRQLDLVGVANEPSVQAQAFVTEIERLASQTWEDAEGRPRTVLTPDEVRVLAIPRGSLTDEERLAIQEHVVHTYQFLMQIPWTKELRRVPEIARSHHEKLDGSGYPYGARAEAIPVQSRMMAIADIYDALTASDRPYKKALRAEEALAILDVERRAGALDSALLDLFLEARVFERVTRQSS